MSNPKCPKCGSRMVLRTARRGPNAGKQFYGCSNYPRCKEILRTNEITDGAFDAPYESSDNSSPTYSFPRRLFARSIKQSCEVQFFESVAVPIDIIENIAYGEIPDQYLKPFLQWRVDYPSIAEAQNFTERHRQLISVAQKILTRGRITLCSPFLETSLKTYFIKNEKFSRKIQIAKEAFNSPFLLKPQNIWLDSPAETCFYERILANLIGKDYANWVLPQVEITSLVPQGTDVPEKGRVDFLIFHPQIDPIVVEIDGEKHKSHKDADNKRDALLSQHGYNVVRIPVNEIDELNGPILSNLEHRLSTLKGRKTTGLGNNIAITKFIWSIKCAHQIQLVLLQAIKTGYLDLRNSASWQLSTNLNNVGLFTEEETLFVLKAAVFDFLELLRNLASLYSSEPCIGDPQLALKPHLKANNNSIHISFGNETDRLPLTFSIQNVFIPIRIAHDVFSTNAAVLDSPNEETLEYFLNYLFRKPRFWEGQFDAISRALQAKDAIVLLPTGSGKSIAFQLAALLLPGNSVVIDPIISLMNDQIFNLAAVGIDRCIAITSQITDARDRSLAINLFGQGEYVFAYIAPERFQTEEFRKSLRALTVHTPVALIIVDEAHCVSEWGHDFRTAYLNIGRTSRFYCESGSHVPALIALTGTASRAVLKDIQRELQIEEFESIITPRSFDRSELRFHVLSSTSDEKQASLIGFLGQKLPNLFASSASTFYQTREDATHSGLVFCPHINGPFGIIEQSNHISAVLGVATSHYSGREPKMWSKEAWSTAKHTIARKFKRNEIPLLVCTKAFGMGIDKPNIRYTIHFGLPSSIESFYQEAGRAGRDRNEAHCCILVSDDNPDRTRILLNPNTTAEEIAEMIERISWDDNDDITRSLFFLTQAFPGISNEKSIVERILQNLPDLSIEKTTILTLPSFQRNKIEKGLHRLLVLGVINDYTVNYSANEFTIKISGAEKDAIIDAYGKYVSGYIEARRGREVSKAEELLSLPYNQFIIEMVGLLLRFIYDVIEKGRRRALQEMLLAATIEPTDEAIRKRILRYLEATQFSEEINQLISGEDAGLAKTRDIFQKVRSPNEAAELRGQVSRALESYPDHPGLLMLRSLSEISCRDKNLDTVKENFLASVSSAPNNYEIKGDMLYDFIAWSIIRVSDKHSSLAVELGEQMLRSFPDRLFARNLIRHLPKHLAGHPAWFLLNRLVESCQRIIISN